jgi:hypothetical protein
MTRAGQNLKAAYQCEASAQAKREAYKLLKGDLEVSIRYYVSTHRK